MTPSNTDMVDYWNSTAGPAWVLQQERTDRFLEPLGQLAIDRLGLRGSERVLDVGCGCGGSTISIAERLGDGGSVLGLDVSVPMVARARERSAGLSNVEFRLDDAQTVTLPPARFDAVFSRFGVMFFADPIAALSNLSRSTVSGGRLSFVCWQSPELNLWMSGLGKVVASVIEMPEPPEPGSPGAFALADRDRIHSILDASRYENIDINSHTDHVPLGADVETVTEMFMHVGPAGSALRLQQAGPALRAAVRREVGSFVASLATASGVRAAAAVWVVSATTP